MKNSIFVLSVLCSSVVAMSPNANRDESYSNTNVHKILISGNNQNDSVAAQRSASNGANENITVVQNSANSSKKTQSNRKKSKSATVLNQMPRFSRFQLPSKPVITVNQNNKNPTQASIVCMQQAYQQLSETQKKWLAMNPKQASTNPLLSSLLSREGSQLEPCSPNAANRQPPTLFDCNMPKNNMPFAFGSHVSLGEIIWPDSSIEISLLDRRINNSKEDEKIVNDQAKILEQKDRLLEVKRKLLAQKRISKARDIINDEIDTINQQIQVCDKRLELQETRGIIRKMVYINEETQKIVTSIDDVKKTVNLSRKTRKDASVGTSEVEKKDMAVNTSEIKKKDVATNTEPTEKNENLSDVFAEKLVGRAKKKRKINQDELLQSLSVQKTSSSDAPIKKDTVDPQTSKSLKGKESRQQTGSRYSLRLRNNNLEVID